MKLIKRTVTLTLILIMLMTSIISASALESPWLSEFRYQFPMLSQGSGKTGYITALQWFLANHNASRGAMDDAGGVDGAYGPGTAVAVVNFQTYAAQYLIPGMSKDGIAGGDTWASVAISLDNQQGGSSYFKHNGIDILKSGYYNGQFALFHVYGGEKYFHTVVGSALEY